MTKRRSPRRAQPARRAPGLRRRDRGEALAELGRALSETLDPEVVARRTVESVRVLLATRNAALYRLGDDGGFESVAFDGEAPADEPRKLVFPPGTGAVSLAIRMRGPLATRPTR